MLCTYISLSLHIYIYIYIHTYIHTYTYMCRWADAYVCIYIYIYMYIKQGASTLACEHPLAVVGKQNKGCGKWGTAQCVQSEVQVSSNESNDSQS